MVERPRPYLLPGWVKLSVQHEEFADILDKCTDELACNCDYCSEAVACSRLWSRVVTNMRIRYETYLTYLSLFEAIYKQRREDRSLIPALERLAYREEDDGDV